MHGAAGRRRLSSLVAGQVRRRFRLGDSLDSFFPFSPSSPWTTGTAILGASTAAYGWWWVTAKTDYYSKSRHHVARLDDNKENPKKEEEQDDEEEKSIHSLFHGWKPSPKDLEALWNKFRHKEASEDSARPPEEPDAGMSSWDVDIFQHISKDIMAFVTGEGQEEAITDLVAQVRSKKKWDIEDTTSFATILDVFLKTIPHIDSELHRAADKFIGDLDISVSFPTALLYYMEYEDERKNPSWKRRMHRFYPGINMEKLKELHHSLQLADIAYADTEEEIRQELKERGYELVFADVISEPGKPAHYVAINRNKNALSFWSMEVVVGVRGTKSVADALTDLLCDSADFRGGKAHSYILTSGRYLVEKHVSLFKELGELSGKKIQLSLVGHSLGAGAASIAGMELADQYDVKVVGFGCPALLSKDLAQKTTFITTIVNDDDMVPRMSGATIANLLMDVMEFDWLPYVKKDLVHALDEHFSAQYTKSIIGTIDPILEDFVRSTVQQPGRKRLSPELYPPGRCIHFYSDGAGKSAAVVPNDFFKEINVSSRMVEDHKCSRGYLKMMLYVVRDHKDDLNFSFDDSEQQPHTPG